MNDRLGDLGELPSWANDNADIEQGDIDGSRNGNTEHNNEGGTQDDPNASWANNNDENGGGNDATPTNKYMASFFSDVESIKEDIAGIIEATQRVSEINEEAVLATTTEKENELSNKLSPLINATNKRAKLTKTLLALLKEDNVKYKNEGEGEGGATINSSDMRIRENLCNTLTRKFIDEMKAYQNAQQKYKADIKKKVKRQVHIVKPEATDEEIDAVMRSEGGKDALFKERILAGGVSDSIKTAYQNVAGKYQDVLTLEASVAELHQMFLDFALLTEQQGELLDQIEFNVKNAADYVEEANVEVHEAIEHSKAARKKQCIIIIIVVVVLIVIIVPIVT